MQICERKDKTNNYIDEGLKAESDTDIDNEEQTT